MSSKIKMSMRDVTKNWNRVFYAGYCELWQIMRGFEPTAYNCGVYGWNCDIYFDYKRDIAINTGYRNMRGKRIPSDLIKEFSENDAKICERPFDPSRNIQAELDENREKFFDALMKI